MANFWERLCWIVVGICSFTGAQCQQTNVMETDRPDQTESPVVVIKKWLQTEIGFNYEKTRSGLTTLVHPTMLVKYGLLKRLELRLITEEVSVKLPLVPDGSEVITGLLPVKLGVKLALIEEKGWLPKTSFLIHSSIPHVSSRKFRQRDWSPDFVLAMQHTLSDNIGLGYNVGAELDRWGGIPTWVYTLTPGFNFGKKTYAYVEVFGFLQRGFAPQHNFDAGLTYALSNNTKVDISYGVGLNKDSRLGHYLAMGCSFRWPVSKKNP